MIYRGGTDKYDDWASENGVRVPPNIRYGSRMGLPRVVFVRPIHERLLARWRIWWNLCPACNSDAPECDTCLCCDGSREYPLSDMRKQQYREWAGI